MYEPMKSVAGLIYFGALMLATAVLVRILALRAAHQRKQVSDLPQDEIQQGEAIELEDFYQLKKGPWTNTSFTLAASAVACKTL